MDAREARRVENIRILLRTLNDIYPGPEAVRSHALSGPSGSSRVPCTFCHRTGRAFSPTAGKVTSCPVCEGAKWRKRRAGEQVWDEMTGSPIQSSSAGNSVKTSPMSPQRLEAELARLEHTLRLHEGEIDPNEAFGWEKAREARDRQASYRELERVLDVMQIEFPLGRSAITSSYFGLSTLPRHLDDLLIGWISERMPQVVRVPKEIYRAQQEELRTVCRAMLRKGFAELEIMAELAVNRRFIRTEAAAMLRVSTGPSPSPAVLAQP